MPCLVLTLCMVLCPCYMPRPVLTPRVVLRQGFKFEDPTFPPENKSIFINTETKGAHIRRFPSSTALNTHRSFARFVPRTSMPVQPAQDMCVPSPWGRCTPVQRQGGAQELGCDNSCACFFLFFVFFFLLFSFLFLSLFSAWEWPGDWLDGWIKSGEEVVWLRPSQIQLDAYSGIAHARTRSDVVVAQIQVEADSGRRRQQLRCCLLGNTRTDPTQMDPTQVCTQQTELGVCESAATTDPTRRLLR